MSALGRFHCIYLCKEKDNVKRLSNFENLLSFPVIFINIFCISNIFYFSSHTHDISYTWVFLQSRTKNHHQSKLKLSNDTLLPKPYMKRSVHEKQFRTFVQCAHVVQKLWRFIWDQNIEVWIKLEWIAKKNYLLSNRGQNLWNNVKKSSKIGQDEKTLWSVFAQFWYKALFLHVFFFYKNRGYKNIRLPRLKI